MTLNRSLALGAPVPAMSLRGRIPTAYVHLADTDIVLQPYEAPILCT